MSADNWERIMKLPLWAQEHIARLERRVADARERAEQAERNDPSPVFIHRFGEGNRYLPDTAISFQVDDTRFDVRIEKNRYGSGFLSVYADDSFRVQPRSSNTMEVYPNG